MQTISAFSMWLLTDLSPSSITCPMTLKINPVCCTLRSRPCWRWVFPRNQTSSSMQEKGQLTITLLSRESQAWVSTTFQHPNGSPRGDQKPLQNPPQTSQSSCSAWKKWVCFPHKLSLLHLKHVGDIVVPLEPGCSLHQDHETHSQTFYGHHAHPNLSSLALLFEYNETLNYCISGSATFKKSDDILLWFCILGRRREALMLPK